MAKVNKWITARKALTRGLQYGLVAVAALQTVPVPESVGAMDQATIAFGIAALGAVAKAIQNYRKTLKKPVRYTSPSGLVVLVALSLALAGCVTTTAPDGTVTTQLDGAALDTAWATWERYEARKALLEKEKAAAREAQDAQRLAIIEAELEKLEPKINELADRLGL